MGKKSNFERHPRDYYPTPYEAVLPLLKFIRGSFIEPCAGDGRLIRHLTRHGLTCAYACDIEPQAEGIEKRDVLFFDGRDFPKADLIITNCPWKREILHPMIELFHRQAPTWLLLDANYMFTKQAKPFLAYCKAIVCVGRVSWADNGVAGFEDAAWFNFIAEETETVFYP